MNIASARAELHDAESFLRRTVAAAPDMGEAHLRLGRTCEAGASPFLRDLAAATGGTAYKVDSTRDIRATFIRILDEFRHRYLVSYTPRGVARGGWHRLEVRVKNRRVSVKARPGYLAAS